MVVSETSKRNSDSDLFNFTSGRFLADEAHHLKARRRVFNVQGLLNVVSKTLGCGAEQIADISKLGEGGFNRIFLITLTDGYKLVARIPYPHTSPRGYAYASEVATMDLLRLHGLPVPEVYGYSFSSDNEAETEYILMEHVGGMDLIAEWPNLKEDDIIAFTYHLAHFEKFMMAIPFPAGGSIFYDKDLKKLSGADGVPIITNHMKLKGVSGFCVGPDLSMPLWSGRREHMDIFRGPYTDVESALTAGAKKELAYLEKFGSPRAPFNRMHRWGCYDSKKQSPLDHAKNLERYLKLAPLLAPAKAGLNKFCLTHPNLHPHNIRIQRGPDGGLQLPTILDWQHAAVLPLFLTATIPEFLDHKGDETYEVHVKPVLRDDLETLTEADQTREKELHRRRLVNHNYALATAVFNRPRWEGLLFSESQPALQPAFAHASAVWEGETCIELLNCLIIMASKWDEMRVQSVQPDSECPVTFTDEEKASADEMTAALSELATLWQNLRGHMGNCLPDTGVHNDTFEYAKAQSREMKATLVASVQEDDETKQMADMIDAEWPFDDRAEEEWEIYK